MKSREYREARDSFLKDEQELVDKAKTVAEKRRTLPPGGQLKEDYVFQWANDGKVGERVKFSELFGDSNALLLYSWMYGPNWDHPCPSCTSLRTVRTVRPGTSTRVGPGIVSGTPMQKWEPTFQILDAPGGLDGTRYRLC